MRCQSQKHRRCHIRLRPQRTTDAAIQGSLEVKVVHGKRLRMRAIQAKDGAYASELVRLRAAMYSRC